MSAYNFSTHKKLNIELQQALENAIALPIPTIKAVQYIKGWRTKSDPVLLECEDGNDYVVKGQQAGRQIVNEQLVSNLGILLEAPVGKPAIVEISQDLIDVESNLKDFKPSTAHGTLWIPNCIDQWELIATGEPENRLRLVWLATLYGWTSANDHQFLFNKVPPRLIHSVDHGHFFYNPNNSYHPNWSKDDLISCIKSSSACLDPYFSDCNFSKQELKEAYAKLLAITEDKIINVVGSVPWEWNFTIEERVIMVEYLIKRQRQLLNALN